MTKSYRTTTKLLKETDRRIVNNLYCQEPDEIDPDDAFREIKRICTWKTNKQKKTKKVAYLNIHSIYSESKVYFIICNAVFL